MLKDKIMQIIENENNIELFPIEKLYAENLGLIGENSTIGEKKWMFPVIERCLKETEEVIKEEDASFIDKPITYFSAQIEEFVYLDSPAFDTIRVDGMAFEIDDVFHTFTVLFGLKIQKKWGSFLKDYLKEHVGLQTSSAMFSDQDGLWDINVPLDALDGFRSDMPLAEAVDLAYRFIFTMLESLEASN